MCVCVSPTSLLCFPLTPQGAHCPAGTSVEIPCSPGYYNPLTGLGGDSCFPCPPGSFQTNFGSTSCSPCSASSVSANASTTCTCLGLNRVFQPTDGYCVCAPGYEFVDENFRKLSEEDGVQPCQPIVFPYCVSGQSRGADGSCVTAASACAQCPSGQGTLAVRTGVCECSGLPALEDVCNGECRRLAPLVSVASNGSLVVTQTDPATGDTVSVSVPLANLTGFAGSLSCGGGAAVSALGPGGLPLQPSAVLTSCRIITLQTSTHGLAGTYDMSAVVSQALASQAVNASRVRLLGEGQRDITRLHTYYNRWRMLYADPLSPHRRLASSNVRTAWGCVWLSLCACVCVCGCGCVAVCLCGELRVVVRCVCM